MYNERRYYGQYSNFYPFSKQLSHSRDMSFHITCSKCICHIQFSPIISYKDGVNKKKIFYKLTPLGEMINEIHNNKHKERNKELMNKINKYTKQEKDIILRFIKDLQFFLTEQE